MEYESNEEIDHFGPCIMQAKVNTADFGKARYRLNDWLDNWLA